MPGRLTFVVSILASLCLAEIKHADACIPIPDASGFTDMQSRRAVIWIKQDTFEMMFQNRYSGDAKDFAWVIPLPGVPIAVGQPSETFLTNIDKYTAPMFEQRACFYPCRSWSVPPDAGVPTDNIPPPDVTIWETGKIGDLDYAVLSASTVADLTAWLDPRGYNLPTALKPLVQDYLDQGFAFFAAKLGAAQQPASVPVVKFVFDSDKTKLVYPLRISAYNRESPLDTLIWVIGADSYVPKGYPSEAMPEVDHTEATYSQALTQVMSKAGGTTFAIQFAEQGVGSYKREMLYYQYGSSDEVEMKAIFAESLNVVRLRASLNPKGTNADLELEKATTPLVVSGWYETPCPNGVEYEKCPDESTPDIGVPDAGPTNDVNNNNSNSSNNNNDTKDPSEKDVDDGGCQVTPLPSLPVLSLLGLAVLVLLGRRRKR